LEQNLDDLLLTTEVNCNATVILTHTFAKRMAAQGRGGIILMASGTALQGSPTFAHYAATKAHNLVFGEALWYELRAHGVDVLSFIPGPTNTPALRSQNPRLKEGVSVGPIQLPGPTAEAALRALGKGPCAARDARAFLEAQPGGPLKDLEARGTTPRHDFVAQGRALCGESSSPGTGCGSGRARELVAGLGQECASGQTDRTQYVHR
jgi:NAD(P)-dependent dehydrogenase (short-subunit alcohol dehydrogenase family)